MKVVLHIGSEKTGSTSIQAALDQNRGFLFENNVFVPDWPDPNLKTHTVLPLLFGPVSFARWPPNHPLHQDGEAAVEAAWAEWDCIITSMRAQGMQTLVLSSEMLFHPLKPEVERFRAALKGVADEVEIIAYLRDPWDFAISSALQTFKENVFQDLSSVQRKLRYRDVLTSYDQHFDGAVKVLEYKPSKLHNQSIVDDFFHNALGLSVPSAAPDINWNVSLSPEMSAISQAFDKRIHRAEAWHHFQPDFALRARLTKVDKRHPSPPIRLTKQAKAWVGQSFDDHDWISQAHQISFARRDPSDHTDWTDFDITHTALEDFFVLDQHRHVALLHDIERSLPNVWAALQNNAKGMYHRMKYRAKRKLWLFRNRT